MVARILRFSYAEPMLRPSFTLPSFAKINLILRIAGKRSDGYHELCTLFQTVSLCDMLSFYADDALGLTCDDDSLPIGDDNIMIKAGKALRDRFKISEGAAMHLEKRIPAPGGLGGGSSNAAAALMGLTRLWGLKASTEDLYGIATGLGADVPFFLHGGTAIGTGRGDSIEPMDDIDEPFILIVTPDVPVSTQLAFDRVAATTLTNGSSNRILRVCRNEAESLDLRHSVLINDFETSVFDTYPEIRRVKATLLKLGAVNAAMSGSGASVFAIFDNTETRQAAEKALDIESTWRKFAVSTVTRAKYREALHL
ncbi:MAG TPA: 4-(cytidine 5'-diphospho)-2-C-methyl-D-erythritol kinase [Pyrinomonadaceae bacterium]|nr:4-(cytidine 5'-diphospho)-2-C-methyl-D-erythritol kinase [Pyrinomonadaceae bacterium]